MTTPCNQSNSEAAVMAVAETCASVVTCEYKDSSARRIGGMDTCMSTCKYALRAHDLCFHGEMSDERATSHGPSIHSLECDRVP
jgi:hypothetical protein